MKRKNVIVGAGFAGSTLARLLAQKNNEQVLVIDKRDHIAGNAYDFKDETGITVHKYGPHIFHTNIEKVWEFLSDFTEWTPYEHKVRAYVDGITVPMPINIDTVNLLYSANYTEENIQEFYDSVKVNLPEIKNSKDMVISKVGEFLYDKLIKNYTKKQWDMYPEELEPEVTARLPVRTNKDDRYFSDKYLYMPKYGFTKMFNNMLDHPNIEIKLNTDFKEIKDDLEYERLIYTGPIDEFFDYKFGSLPYRSLDIVFETISQEQLQEVAVINYPNDYEYTRISEYKHYLGEKSEKTVISKEYSQNYIPDENIPYYPIPQSKNKELYNQYKFEADKLDNVYFLGRLGQYRYLNMDAVVKEAIELFEAEFQL